MTILKILAILTAFSSVVADGDAPRIVWDDDICGRTYMVWYNGKKLDTNMWVFSDYTVAPAVGHAPDERDEIHFDGVHEKCTESRDSEATLFIVGPHGEGKYECLWQSDSDPAAITGSRYSGGNVFWGTIEYRLIDAADCFASGTTNVVWTYVWTYVGTGGMGGCGGIKIGTASSLPEAKDLMLKNEQCAKEGGVLFYSRYSYASSWGVLCSAPEMLTQDCQMTDNPNWTQYQLSFEGIHAGEYTVWYKSEKRDTNMHIYCDYTVEQPGLFVDQLHFDGVHEKCTESRDSNATMFILDPHGLGTYECLWVEDTTITGSHYTGSNVFCGTIEYRLIDTISCIDRGVIAVEEVDALDRARANAPRIVEDDDICPGEYMVWYQGTKRDINMWILRDYTVAPAVGQAPDLRDEIHFDGVREKCTESRDSEATLLILGPHGEGNYECLWLKDSDSAAITGSRYSGANVFLGTIEYRLIDAASCFASGTTNVVWTYAWTYIGTGGLGGCGGNRIGTASSLPEAKDLMLKNENCAKEGGVLFYSRYSYWSSWGVLCSAPEMLQDCQMTDNPNWTKYQLSFVGIHAGEYTVWYKSEKRDTNMQIYCDYTVEQPGHFVDQLHFDGVHEKCTESRDSKATMFILDPHGAGKYECLWVEDTTITGSHYTGPNLFWGTIEYRLIDTISCVQQGVIAVEEVDTCLI